MELENKSKEELIALVKTMGADQSEQTAKKILEVDSSKFELSLSQDGLVLDADLHFIKLMADEEQSILNRPFIRYLQPEYIDRFEASLKLCVNNPVFEANNYLIIDAHNQVQVMNLLMYRKPGQDTIQVIGQPCESISQVDLSAQTSWSHSDSPHHNAPKTQSINSSANWTWDQLTDQFHGSSIFYEIFGQTASQHHFTGAQFYRQIFPQDLDLVKSELKKSSDEQVPFEILFRIWRKDGKMAWVFWLGKFYYNHSGEPILIAGSCSDLTQQIKTEEALQIAKNRYQSMFENAFDGIFLLKRETIVDCNESMVKLLEWPKEAIIGKKPINFSGSKKHTSTQLKHIANNFLKHIQEDGSVALDWTIQKRSGQVVPVEVRAQSLKIDNEALIMIFIRDRSKQNQLEKRRSLLESAIENAENAMATIHSSEEAGQPYISYVNPSFEKITGYTQEEICSDPILICSKLIANEALVEELRIKIEKGKAFENELKIIRASGESRWVQLNMQPIYTSQEVFLLCTMKDINTRVLQKTMMDQFMKLGTDGFAIFDSQGYFREASIAWENMLGYSISQLKRKTAMELIHPDDLEKSTLGFMDLFEGKTIKGFINRYQHAEGHYVDLSWNVYPDAEGDRFYTMARDITGQMALMRELGEAKNLLEDKVTVRTKELEQSNQRLERFAFIASHDLRTPLRMISNFMSLLEKKIQHKLSDDEKDLFQFAVNGAKDMDGLIEAILKYSRAQRAIPKFENIDTLKNIQAVVITCQDILDQKNGEITIQPIPNLQVDRIQFRQIMQNLIGNALKFSSEEAPKIEISCETKKDRVHISVSDNGIGMDLSGDFNIFDLFEKGKGPKAEGHGIGLAICRDFVQNHGGEIRVVSEPGKGSTFYFDMPKSADVEAA